MQHFAVLLERDTMLESEIDPAARLTRAQAADALTRSGYPTAPATLATLATRGGGPPFAKFGSRVQYLWGDVLGWARGRTSKTVHSTSELRSARVPTHLHEAHC
jgi:hypothetical protein